MIELYSFPTSTCSLKVRICLAEKGMEYKEHRLSPGENGHLTDAYLRMNPNGVVPTLVHDGTVVIDSSVILEYLDEVFPEPSFSPASPADRAKMRAWLRFFEEKPTPAVRYPTFQKFLIHNYTRLSPEQFEKAAERRPLKTDFYKRMGQDGFAEAEIAKAMDDVRLTLDRMETELAANGPWIMGDQYTLADMCVAPLIDRMDDLGHRAMWESAHPAVTAWFAAMRSRPAFEAAYYPGSRMSEFYPERA